MTETSGCCSASVGPDEVIQLALNRRLAEFCGRGMYFNICRGTWQRRSPISEHSIGIAARP
jgi:hypothetical protein